MTPAQGGTSTATVNLDNFLRQGANTYVTAIYVLISETSSAFLGMTQGPIWTVVHYVRESNTVLFTTKGFLRNGPGSGTYNTAGIVGRVSVRPGDRIVVHFVNDSSLSSAGGDPECQVVVHMFSLPVEEDDFGLEGYRPIHENPFDAQLATYARTDSLVHGTVVGSELIYNHTLQDGADARLMTLRFRNDITVDITINLAIEDSNATASIFRMFSGTVSASSEANFPGIQGTTFVSGGFGVPIRGGERLTLRWTQSVSSLNSVFYSTRFQFAGRIPTTAYATAPVGSVQATVLNLVR